MKKDYQAPEVEIISLTAQESTTSKDMLDGSMGIEDSIFD